MKKCVATLMILPLLLSGCEKTEENYNTALNLRDRLQNCESCSFETEVTADYGDEIYSFVLECESESTGELRFTVLKPETISGVSGVLSDISGHLTFDDQLLAFEMLADDQLSPICAPWILLKAIRGGYIRSCGTWEKGSKCVIDDSYSDDSFQTDIYLDAAGVPCEAEILWDGRRILSLHIDNFVCE